MSKEFSSERLELSDVINMKGHLNIMSYPTFKFPDLLKRVGDSLGLREESRKVWLEDGIECEILSPRQEWRNGKIRIIVEFIPETVDQADPELDELRQMITE